MQDGKLSRVTSLLGPEPRGESRQGLSVTQAESGLRKSLSFRDSLQLPSQTGLGGRHALRGKQPTTSGQWQCDLSWYSSAWIPAHLAATRWHVRQTIGVCVTFWAFASPGERRKCSRANLIRRLTKGYTHPHLLPTLEAHVAWCTCRLRSVLSAEVMNYFCVCVQDVSPGEFTTLLFCNYDSVCEIHGGLWDP